jgi:hypothetical protein
MKDYIRGELMSVSIRKKIMLTLLGIIIMPLAASCGGGKPSTLAPATSTLTTKTAGTSTKTAPETITSSPTVNLSSLVSGTPLPEWHQIPLMPAASAGGEKNNQYYFTIKATQGEIEAFYDLELQKLGWGPKKGNGTAQPSGIITLVYYKDKEVCYIGIIPQKTEMLVTLSRQAKK